MALTNSSGVSWAIMGVNGRINTCSIPASAISRHRSSGVVNRRGARCGATILAG